MKTKNLSFKDNNGKRFNLTAKLNDGKFTISGEMGQEQDNISPLNDQQKELVSIWNTYHLNDMNAGTTEQAKIVSGKGFDYAKCLEELCRTNKDGTKNNHVYSYLNDNFEHAKRELESLERWKKSDLFDQAGEDASREADPKNESYYEKQKKQLTANMEYRESKLINTMLYDTHPTTGKPYKYGSAWLTTVLPSDFWADFITLCDDIEEIEEEARTGAKVVDIATLANEGEGRATIEAQEEAQEDENAAALALHLNLTIEELSEIETVTHNYGNCSYKAEGTEYYCGTWDEIIEALTENIGQSLWAFSPSFLSQELNLPIELFEALINNDKCEGNNEAIQSIIDNGTEGIKSFVESAERADGWAHFLNSYDGNGDELSYNGTTYHICRI